MKLEFLYTDNSYTEKIKDINISNNIILSKTNKRNLFIFSYEIKGENIDNAKMLSKIKIQVEKIIEKDKCFLLEDGASEYYNKQLYPLYNHFERELRQIITLSAIQYDKENTKKLARQLEIFDFGEIYKALFTSSDFWDNFKKIKSDERLSKKDLISKINAIEEKTIWSETFTAEFPFLPNNFDKIRQRRNDIMHAHNINYDEYQHSKKLIENAINDLDKIKILITDGTKISNSLSKKVDEYIVCSELHEMFEEKMKASLKDISNITNVLNHLTFNFNKANDTIKKLYEHSYGKDSAE